ncbi:dickkopf-related protein 3 [Hydra vulgaris]|uniref:Dickkopf-related protein 3 n=1 Tax=Hydra vulgaris TaxID=6087 RepID=A0ABM4D2E8_HYDVU
MYDPHTHIMFYILSTLLIGALVKTALATDGEFTLKKDTDESGSMKVKKMIAPGYYSQECNVHKPCPDPTKYCHMFLCVDCLKENVACTQNGQCCPGTECTYGRCKKGSSKGAAGTFCDRQKDCVGPDLCCVREPAINPVISICKPALDEHQTCGPYNQFRTVYIGGTVQPVCGPCKQGLVCKQVGIFGVHEICLPSGGKGKK